METLDELLAKVYRETPLFVARLNELKAQNPQISWYPFRSMDKVQLISRVANFFDGVEIGFLSKPPKILDIGAADGDLSFLFESVGCDVVAIDNAPSNYNRCLGIRFMREILGSSIVLIEKDIDYDFSIDGQYDLILFLDILYHLRNPLGTLISLCQLGKYMIFTTRIFEAGSDNESVCDAPYAYLLAPFEAAAIDPTNYWIFTETALERLLERSGWRILKKAYFGYNGSDSSAFDPQKDKRVICLCERVEGYERLKYGHIINLYSQKLDNMRDDNSVLVGHPFAPIGRGEEIRCVFRAFQAVGLTLPIYDIYSFRSDPDIEKELGPHVVQGLSAKANIFYINGDEVDQVLAHLGNQLPNGAYNIICPQWELSVYPREWTGQLERFNEIWAPSKFVFDSIQRATSKPVFYIPLPVQIKINSFLERRYFGLPESAYLFLFFFDFKSYIDRKNPFAVIEAFEKVCADRPHDDLGLVIKLSGLDSAPKTNADWERFMAAVNQSQNRDQITIIDKVFTRNEIEIKNLVRCCDCFVSLHRSEGFGRGMAEAMYLGKPVVATGYSGNLDFMNKENSCLVSYELISVEEGQYPYPKGQIWAEPDIDHAVHYMLKLVDDRDYGRKLGQIASRHIRTYFSYRALGLRYKQRLEEIIGCVLYRPK